MQPAAFGPTAILSMYISGACKRHPFGATATTAKAPGSPLATNFVPSRGSTAISISKAPSSHVPIFSPI